MFKGCGEKRIAFRLDTLTEAASLLTPVESRQRAFAESLCLVSDTVSKSPLGRALLKSAQDHGVSAGLDPLLEPNSSFFYPGRNHIDLGYQPGLLTRTEKGLGRYLVSFTGALRRAWHYHAGFGLDFSLVPRGFLDLFRIAEADAEAVVHQVAWDLRSRNLGFLWRCLLSGTNGDIAVVFERNAAQNLKNTFCGPALKSAFNQWFAEKERVAAADHVALEIIDMALVQPRLPQSFASRSLARQEMQRIGKLPASGRTSGNYLEGCLFTNPWYPGFECEINRAHLRHIEKDIKTLIQNQQHIH